MPLLAFEALVAVAGQPNGSDGVLPSELAPLLECSRETAAMSLSRLTARGDAAARVAQYNRYHERVYYTATEQGRELAAATMEKLKRLYEPPV